MRTIQIGSEWFDADAAKGDWTIGHGDATRVLWQTRQNTFLLQTWDEQKGIREQDLEASEWEYIEYEDAAKAFLNHGLQDELPDVLKGAFAELEI